MFATVGGLEHNLFLMHGKAVFLNIQLDKNNIRERLSIRDTQKDFREMGIFNEKQKAFDAKTINKFANAFDKAITDLKKRK